MSRARQRITVEDLAYAAGIIDGEGCICIHKGLIKRTSGTKRLQFQLTVVVAMTDEPVLRWLCLKFGGRVDEKTYPAEKGYKKQWRWTLTSRAAERFLWIVYPWLVVKKSQARLAFVYRDSYTRVNRVTLPEVQGLRLWLYKKMKMLKR